jgi:hypothetical protein
MPVSQDENYDFHFKNTFTRSSCVPEVLSRWRGLPQDIQKLEQHHLMKRCDQL